MTIRDLALQVLAKHPPAGCFTFHSLGAETVKHPVSAVVSGETAVERALPKECRASLNTTIGPFADTVAGWTEAFLSLSPDAPPRPSFRRWPAVHRACRRFLEDHAERAAGLDWSAVELFGVHPVVGTVRVDCSGALMLSDGVLVVEVDPDTIRLANGLTFYRSVLPPEASVPVWEFGK